MTTAGSLGPYEIKERLPLGPGIEAYAGFDTVLARSVALVRLPFKAQNSARVERVLDNALKVSFLDHPNLVLIHSLETLGEAVYLVTAPLAGQQLSDRLEEAPLHRSRAVEIARAVLNALGALHDSGLTHGQLTTDHVFLAEGNVRLLYLGGAVSPQQRLEPAEDPRSDILAFGHVLQAMMGEPQPAAKALPDVPWTEVISGCMLPIGKRFQSVPDVQEALGWTASHEARPRSVLAVPAIGIGWALAALGLGLGGLGGLFFWLQESSPQRDPTKDLPSLVATETLDPATLAELARLRGYLQPAHFVEETAELRPDALESLDRVALMMRENPDIVVTVEGHAKPTGFHEFSLTLSDQRATAVNDYLRSLGINETQLRIEAYGERLPRCTDPTPACSALNERVEFTLGGERRYTWNHWVETADGGLAPETLGSGLHSVVFDLSALDYGLLLEALETVDAERVASDGVTPRLERELQDAVLELAEPGASKYAHIWVQPVLAGDGLRFAQGSDKAQKITIALTRLARPPPLTTTPEWAGDLAREASALRQRDTDVWAPIRVYVKAGNAVGCPAVALSIWNESVDRPLDAVAHLVPLNGADCSKVRPSADTLDDRMLGLYGADDDRDLADAALHLFELDLGSAKPRSLAVFHDGRKFFTWELAGPFSEFVGDDLAAAVGTARAASRYDFAAVSDKIKAELFTAREQPSTAATDAKAALTDLAASENPRLFARLVDRSGRSLFLPLGLLEFGDKQPLAKRAKIIQPFFRDDFAEKSCIASWTTVIPPTRDALDSPPAEAYWKISSTLPGRIDDWTAFGKYLRPEKQPVAAEGLIVLAHHEGGSIWWEKGDKEPYRTIGRAFAPGSVAVFASCSAGALDDLGFAARLEENHIDAAILAPVPVKVELALRFATNFAEQARNAGAAGSSVTLEELFERTVAALEEDDSILDAAAAYEFLLAGNGKLRTCGANYPLPVH